MCRSARAVACGYTLTDMICSHSFAILYLQVVLPPLGRRHFHDFTNFSFAGSPCTISRSTFSGTYRFRICRQLYYLQQDTILTILLTFYLHFAHLYLARQPFLDFTRILFAGNPSAFSMTTFSRYYSNFICRQLFYLQQNNLFSVLQLLYLQVAYPPLARKPFLDFTCFICHAS